MQNEESNNGRAIHAYGEFCGVRALLAEELRYVAGGDLEDPPTDLGTVTVTAEYDGTPTYAVSVWTPVGTFPGEHSDSEVLEPEKSDPDKEAIEIDIEIDRELTAEEQAAVDALVQAVVAATQAINEIPADAQITLSNGDTVSGAELKLLWQSTDFTINDNAIYENGSGRGEADYNHGDPMVSLNIDNLVGYNVHGAEGMNYLVLHELGHMTSAGREMNQLVYADGILEEGSPEWIENERIANDIAKAIGDHAGMPILDNPAGGYSDTTPTFT